MIEAVAMWPVQVFIMVSEIVVEPLHNKIVLRRLLNRLQIINWYFRSLHVAKVRKQYRGCW